MGPTIVWERKYYRRCVLIVRHDAKKVGKYFVHLNKNEAKFVVDRKKTGGSDICRFDKISSATCTHINIPNQILEQYTSSNPLENSMSYHIS